MIKCLLKEKNAMKPFEFGCVVKGDVFCPRPEIESILTSNMESGQNTVVVGERRMGKTSLIMSAFSKTRKSRLLYVDLLNIRTIADFCDRVASAASRMGKGLGFIQKTLSFLVRLRPTLSVDPYNGMPVVSVDSRLAEHVSSIEDIVAMIEKFSKKERVVVVFDEFQEILKLDNPEQVLATLRSRIQFLSETCFVYSGSVRRDMVRMFIDYKSPFYKSAATLNVGAIDDDRFIDFLQSRFAVGGRKVARELLLKVLEAANRVSGDVQQLCDAMLMETDGTTELSESDIGKGIERILKQESSAFELQTENLSKYQMKALRGVAKFGGKKVFSAEFIERAGLSSAPTAKRALGALVDHGILYCHEKEYKIFNPFLKEWVSRIS